MKILVVDDSTSTLNFTKKLLTSSGYEVDTAGNGAAALDKYATLRPDLVLLDITMPLMDGKETLRRILELDKNATVIMTTAIDDGEIIQGYLARGAVGYIVKPFGFDELITTIQNAMNSSKNKSTTTFFSLVRNRIESDIRKMTDPVASIVLKEAEVINQERSPQTFTKVEQIRVIPQIKQNLEFDNIQDYRGYVTEFNGSRNGEIITLVKLSDLDTICLNLERTLLIKVDQLVDFHDDIEFFNIINQKVITVLSNSLRLSFSREPIRTYDEAKDKTSNWNDVVKATFELKLNKPILLNIILCSGRRYQKRTF
jgi:two-component system chemotaxis response regulator CheY